MAPHRLEPTTLRSTRQATLLGFDFPAFSEIIVWKLKTGLLKTVASLINS